jgi:hypothetical protein
VLVPVPVLLVLLVILLLLLVILLQWPAGQSWLGHRLSLSA